MKLMYFSINITIYRYFTGKKPINFIYNHLLQLRLLLCWHSHCGVSFALCNVRVKLSKKILDVHPKSDSIELAEAVPIDWLICFYVIPFILSSVPLVCLCSKAAYIANNMDPDQTALWEQSDQGLSCLLPFKILLWNALEYVQQT